MWKVKLNGKKDATETQQDKKRGKEMRKNPRLQLQHGCAFVSFKTPFSFSIVWIPYLCVAAAPINK